MYCLVRALCCRAQSTITVSVTVGTNVRSYLEGQAEGALKRLSHLQGRKNRVYTFIDLRL